MMMFTFLHFSSFQLYVFKRFLRLSQYIFFNVSFFFYCTHYVSMLTLTNITTTTILLTELHLISSRFSSFRLVVENIMIIILFITLKFVIVLGDRWRFHSQCSGRFYIFFVAQKFFEHFESVYIILIASKQIRSSKVCRILRASIMAQPPQIFDMGKHIFLMINYISIKRSIQDLQPHLSQINQLDQFNFIFLYLFLQFLMNLFFVLLLLLLLMLILFQISMKNQYKLPIAPKAITSGHSGPIYVIKFNKSGQYCMTGSEDRSVCLYNPIKNIMIKQYKNLHNYDVYGLDISKDNSKFITGGGDKLVMLTDVIQGKCIRKYTGHHGRVNSVCFNEENNVIISGSYDTSIRIWDNKSNANHPIEKIKGFKDSVSKVIVDGYEIIGGSMDGTIKIFDIRKGQVTTDAIQEPIQCFAWANSGKAYTVSATNNRIYLIEKFSGKKIMEYKGHEVKQFTIDCVFNYTDTHIITGSCNGQLYIYDILKNQPIKSMKGHSQILSAIDVHQQYGYVTASHDGTVNYWKC